MVEDLSKYSRPISNFAPRPLRSEEWQKYRLADEQVAFFNEFGYLRGIRILDDKQVEQLQQELQTLVDPKHPCHELFYEFHTNESADPNRVLFHALGAWRITP